MVWFLNCIYLISSSSVRVRACGMHGAWGATDMVWKFDDAIRILYIPGLCAVLCARSSNRCSVWGAKLQCKSGGPGGLVVYGPNALVSCSPLWTTHSRSHSRRFRSAKTDRPPTDGCAPNQATKVTNGYHKDEIVAQQTHTFCGRAEGKVFG